ncbi:AraC family transcriptional regulator ligand-binding domain-containing protein [Bradyrhizobium sp. 2TAF24]|uniref:AraC family transcriptional regulator n=1 Tax=Bradyrhizobium sp. 2TAF24 TaxID=3233011 RepID=UPI003F8FEF21
MMHQGVPLSWIRRHGAGAMAEGISEAEIFRNSLIDLDAEDDDAEIDSARYFLFWLNLARGIEDACHGLCDRRLRLGSSALAMRIMLGSATLENALQSVERFYRLALPSLQLKLDVAGNEARLLARHEGRSASADTVMDDVALSWLFMCCGGFLGRPLPVADVVTRDPTHFNLGQRHWSIRAPVSHGSVAAIRFPKALLGARRGSPSSDAALWDCTRRWLRFVDEAEGEPLADVEVRKEMTPAQARRERRREPGYRQSRQRALADAGVRLLRSTDASVDAVACQLGYADARSFRRFIKGATGRTPHQIRSTATAGGEASTVGPAVYARIRETAALLE